MEMNMESRNRLFMYVSSWREHGGAPGLAFYRFDQKRGVLLSGPGWIDRQNSYGFSRLDPKRNLLYVNNEVIRFRGALCESGRIFVYHLDPADGRASLLAAVPTMCPNPSFLSVNRDGTFLFVAHHSTDGGIAVHEKTPDGKIRCRIVKTEADVQTYRLNENGIPAELVCNIDHGKYKEAAHAHPHSAVLSPSGNYLAVADKGSGFLYFYRVDPASGVLNLQNKVLTDVEGAHPRYVLFHPAEPYLFVNHEASLDGGCYVSSFRYSENGSLERTDRINALELFHPELVQAPIRLEQQGFVMNTAKCCLYTLISSANILAVLRFDRNGKLCRVQNVPVEGIWPRGLAISPDSRYVLASCLVSGEIICYPVKEDGTLCTGSVIGRQKGASWITFYPAGN